MNRPSPLQLMLAGLAALVLGGVAGLVTRDDPRVSVGASNA
ncbi:MAG: hypothetical protein U0Q22_07900 [Acidimicrobiales bacterium]